MNNFEEEDKKSILLTMVKKSYRNGVLKMVLQHQYNNELLSYQNNLVNTRHFTIIHNYNMNVDLCVSVVAHDGFYYYIDIVDLITNKPPSIPFKILVTAYLFDNEMQYFSLPLNFRGKRK